MKAKPTAERVLVDRAYIAQRWGISKDTIRRRQKAGFLTPISIGPNTVRYDLAEVLKYEEEAAA